MGEERMRVTVKLFAGLRERLGYSDREIELPEGRTVADVWQAVAADEPLSGNVLMAVNMDYVKPDAPVSDGDEVAFFPPVTGG